MKKSAMALSVPLVIVLLFSASSSLAMAPSGPVQWGKLDPHFYDQSRPQGRMASVLGKAHYQDPRMAASLLRLHFHDCFVKAGCDASLLLDSSGSMVSEKRSNHNKADEIIDEIKAAIEAACCPGTVSCADILALAARDSTEAAAAPVAVPAASVACSPLLQAPRKWLKGTTTLHIIGTGTGTSTAPSAPPPTPPERMQHPHTTKVPRWLITLISALSAILGVGGLVGYGVHYCCYNNRVEVYITISGTIKKIKLINRRWPRPVTCR